MGPPTQDRVTCPEQHGVVPGELLPVLQVSSQGRGWGSASPLPQKPSSCPPHTGQQQAAPGHEVGDPWPWWVASWSQRQCHHPRRDEGHVATITS